MKFTFEAITTLGQVIKGEIIAASHDEAKKMVEGFIPRGSYLKLLQLSD